MGRERLEGWVGVWGEVVRGWADVRVSRRGRRWWVDRCMVVVFEMLRR